MDYASGRAPGEAPVAANVKGRDVTTASGDEARE